MNCVIGKSEILFLLRNWNYVIGKSEILFLPIAIGIRNSYFIIETALWLHCKIYLELKKSQGINEMRFMPAENIGKIGLLANNLLISSRVILPFALLPENKYLTKAF